MTDSQIIHLIETRKESRAMEKLYRYQSVVKKMIISKGGTTDDALDIFQEALIILCKKVWQGNFLLKSKLDTYIYGVCYNLWRDRLKTSKDNLHEEMTEEYPLDDELELLIEKEEKIMAIEHVLKQIGDACKQLLKLFYYDRKKVKDIVKELGYSSENTVKVQKYKCIERAKKMIGN